jgi:hypothetical protein
MVNAQQPQGPRHGELTHRGGQPAIRNQLAELDPKLRPVLGSQAALNPLAPGGQRLALGWISNDRPELR